MSEKVLNKQSKHAVICISCIVLISVQVISNPFNLIGMIIALVAVCGLLPFCFLKTEKNIVDRCDLYLLFTVIGITGGQFGVLLDYLDMQVLESVFSKNSGWKEIYVVVVIIVICIVNVTLEGLYRKRQFVLKSLMAILAASIFVAFGYELLDFGDYLILFLIIVFYTYYSSLSNQANNDNVLNRNFWITFLTLAIFVARRLVFSGYYFFKHSLQISVNFTLLPFYVVGAIVTVLIVVAAIDYITSGRNEVTSDSMLCVWLLGLVVIPKTVLYFHFTYSWVFAIFSLMIITILVIPFQAVGGDGSKFTFTLTEWYKNPLFFSLFFIIATCFVVIELSKGQGFFILSCILSFFIVRYIPRMTLVSWKRDVLSGVSHVLALSLMARTRIIPIGFSMKKIIFVVGLAIIVSAFIIMLEHKNDVGHNKFTYTRHFAVIVFALLLLVPINKAGTHISILTTDDTRINANYVEGTPNISINIEADGKGNYISSLRYVWTDNFIYDSEDVRSSKENVIETKIQKPHLIVWVKDSNGVETRKDFWFAEYK